MPKPKESTVLVVVDMQPVFTCDSKIIEKVACLLRGAKRDRVPVIFLELGSKTHPELTSIMRRCKKCRIITKKTSDGSAEVQTFCKELSIKPKHFVVCGVYFTGCVYATVVGLHKKYKKARFSVVKDASDCRYKNQGLCYQTYKRTKLIKLGQKG